MGPPSATVTQGQTVLLLGFDVSHRGIFRTAQVVVKKFFHDLPSNQSSISSGSG
jgi:hypothetical protein